MKVAGVIAEYNPFHNGHKYQLEQIRQKTKADYIVVAMSGDFLQRGVPALTDKYNRARMALSAGADLVLELPAVWATSSAEYFAAGGVTLLGKTGVIDYLCYGCETVDTDLFHAIVSVLSENLSGNTSAGSGKFQEHLSTLLKSGVSFPTARSKAVAACLPDVPSETVASFLSSPNNILGLEYEKALRRWTQEQNSSISFSGRQISGIPLQRVGEGYHSNRIDGSFASATAIRSALFSACSTDISSAESIPATSAFAQIQSQMPAESFSFLQTNGFGSLLDTDDFSDALYTKLLLYQHCGYENFADCSRELSCKIQNYLHQFVSFSQFASLLKSKEITYTRICRVLLHILLNIMQEDYAVSSMNERISYLRVLGFRKDSAPLLSAIKKETSAPLITKVADASHVLSGDRFWQHDLFAANLYRGISSIHQGLTLPNEYQHPLVIV